MQLTKSVDKNDNYSTYMHKIDPCFLTTKLKAGNFDSPQIYQAIRDKEFESLMDKMEF